METITLGIKRLKWSGVFKTAGLLTLVLAMSAPVYAAPRITSSISSQQPELLTAEEARSVSVAAGKLLRHVEKARRDILKKKAEKAAEHIAKGLDLVDIIENTVPPYEVHTTINAGDLRYDEVDQVGQRFVPIYAEFHHVALFDSVLAAQKKLNQKTQHNRITKKIYAPVVEGVAEEYTSVNLDVFLARDMLEEAKGMLEVDDLETADVALETLQTEGVFFDFVVADAPLEKAAENIQMAVYELKRNHPEKARAEIERALDGMNQYKNLTSKERAAEVTTLYGKIDELSKSVKNGLPKDGMKAASHQLDTYWNQIQVWLNKV